jgi:prepilin-type N-terminal cleavage/methylation domain-containing protein
MRSDQGGFTLLEMLIGITLMALLMAAVLTGLRVATKAWQAGEDRMALVYGRGERADFMARQIASLVPYKVNSTEPKLLGEYAILEAKPACFRFLSTYGSRYRNRSGMMLVEYGLVSASPGTEDLCVRETPVANDESLLRQIVQRKDQDPDTGELKISYQPFTRKDSDLCLRKNLQAARFDYLVPGAHDEVAHWASDWQPGSVAEFPSAIRLSWEQDGHQEQSVFPTRGDALPQ